MLGLKHISEESLSQTAANNKDFTKIAANDVLKTSSSMIEEGKLEEKSKSSLIKS